MDLTKQAYQRPIIVLTPNTRTTWILDIGHWLLDIFPLFGVLAKDAPSKKAFHGPHQTGESTPNHRADAKHPHHLDIGYWLLDIFPLFGVLAKDALSKKAFRGPHQTGESTPNHRADAKHPHHLDIGYWLLVIGHSRLGVSLLP
ncbi:MAG: hypothetical protein J0M29_22265 [Chitinophagales bacterium]|nr:hypothetical protein [Chitinophagales bacterium]